MLKKAAMALALTGIMAGVALAGPLPKSGINGSRHDMNTAGGTPDMYGRTCAFCHTPHNATTSEHGPLWNRAENTALIPAYTWKATLNTGIAIPDPTVGPTRLCLSCHDGSIAVDSHGSNGSQFGTRKLSGDTKILDMKITHPIGFDYIAAQTARTSTEIVPATAYFLDSASASFDTHNRTAGTGKTILGTLYQGTIMTCASCHEVHNTTNATATGTNGYNYFLHAREEGSAICLSCHVK